MLEYLDIKKEAIEDSKNINFEGMDNSSKLNTALVKLKEKQISTTKGQMVYVSNLLIPDDEKFLNTYYDKDKSIKALAVEYGVPDYVINTKIIGLQNEIDNKNKKEETVEPAQEEAVEPVLKEVVEPITPVQVETGESITTVEEEKEPITPVQEVETDNFVQTGNIQKQETKDIISDLDMFFKKTGSQEEQISNLNNQIQALNDEIVRLQQKNQELEEENTKNSQLIDVLNEDISNRKKANKELEEQLLKKDQNITALNKTMLDLEKEVDTLTDALQEKNNSINDLTKDIENKDLANSSLRRELDNSRSENTSLQGKINTLESYKTDYDNIVAYLNQNLQKDEQRLAS